MTIYPNPQLKRSRWVDLNGEWDFEIKDLKDYKDKTINVPYCPESVLSGINYQGYIKECLYQKKFLSPVRSVGDRVILHFGAVDYEAKVYVNGKYVGRHTGGYTPFCFDITDLLYDHENVLKVKVYDDPSANVPSGKQCEKLNPYGCFYTRTTGIWQSVWLEIVPDDHITYIKFYSNIADCSVSVEVGTVNEGELVAEVLFGGKKVGEYTGYVKCKSTFKVGLAEKHLWTVGKGNLYEVKFKYGRDEVESYFGLREVRYEGMKFLLNEKPVFQRLVLDQGYYPNGVYTPDSEEDFERDIKSALALGFNGIRLHQKVFDPLYLYYCDKLGVMVWGEFPSWGIKYDNISALGVFIKEWSEAIERDFNHPCIITWCPLNETWKNLEDQRKSRDVKFLDSVYSVTKKLDPTRPCVDVSGGFHGHKTDLFDFHCYESYDNLKRYLTEFEGKDILDVPLLYADNEPDLKYKKGLPVNISEFGGKRLNKEGKADTIVETINECAVTSEDDWGYGNGISDEDDFVKYYTELVELILGCKKISGFCYTQLYDIEQEQNGFFTYERTPKLSEEAMRQIVMCNRLKAQIEE